MKITELLKGKAGLFFTVNALASIGLNIGIVGVNWFIISSTGQNEVLGIYGALSLAVAFLTLIFAGTFTDKYNKVAIMKYCCLGQALLFFLTAASCLLGVPAIYIIYALALLNMPCMVIFTTVSRGAIPAVWDKSELSKGNSIIEITIQVGAMFAALLTGFLYHAFGFSLLIFVGAVLTLGAYLILCFSKYSFDYELPEKEGFLLNIKRGIAYLRGRKDIFFYGLVVFVPTVVISASNTVIPGYVEQYLGGGPLVYGFGDMVFAVGAMFAGFLAHRFISPTQRPIWQNILFAVGALSLALFVINKNIYLFLINIFITGVAIAGLRVLLNTSFMEVVKSEYLGRTLSLLMAISMAVQALLSYLIGLIMDSWKVTGGYWVLIGLMLAGLLGLQWIRFEGEK
ncbi:MAG: MFS transporter [Elusimicrobiaceae bacterium]